MTLPDFETLTTVAREIVRSHAQDIERMSVGEMMADNDRFAGLSEDEFEQAEEAIYNQARALAEALSWPDELPHDADQPPTGHSTAAAVPRLFRLLRDVDHTGVSGPGHVADGIVWPDGTVTLRWGGEHASTVCWDTLGDARAVHGHGGATRFVFDDEPDGQPQDEQAAKPDWSALADQYFTEAAQAERDALDARVAELERELLVLRGTELNPSPTILDAQSYADLRDEIAATMADEWDLDEAEISILIKYVRWLAAGQPRDEDGYPIRRESYSAAEQKAAQDGRDGDVRAVAPCCGGPHAGWIHVADCANPAASDVEQQVLLPLLLKDDAMRTAAARLAAGSEDADVASWYTARAAVRERGRIAALDARDEAEALRESEAMREDQVSGR